MYEDRVFASGVMCTHYIYGSTCYESAQYRRQTRWPDLQKLATPCLIHVWTLFEKPSMKTTQFFKNVFTCKMFFFAVFYRAHCVRKVLRFAVLTKESFTLMHTSYTYPQYMWSAALYMYINVCTYKQTHWKSLNPPCSWVWLRA